MSGACACFKRPSGGRTEDERGHANPQMCGMAGADEEDGIGSGGRRRGVGAEEEEEHAWKGEGGGTVYRCLKGSGCCVQINKRQIIAEGLYIYFLS